MIICDFDGTLVDSFSLKKAALDQLCPKELVNLEKKLMTEVLQKPGETLSSQLENIFLCSARSLYFEIQEKAAEKSKLNMLVLEKIFGNKTLILTKNLGPAPKKFMAKYPEQPWTLVQCKNKIDFAETKLNEKVDLVIGDTEVDLEMAKRLCCPFLRVSQPWNAALECDDYI